MKIPTKVKFKINNMKDYKALVNKIDYDIKDLKGMLKELEKFKFELEVMHDGQDTKKEVQ